MSIKHRMPLLASAGLFALCAIGVLAAMLAWANPASAQNEPLPRLIISPTQLHVGEGDSVTYTVHFDRNPSGFDNVECGEPVYVNMRGFDSSEFRVEPFTPAFRTGNSNCEGGNWNRPRTISVTPVDENDVDMGRRTITIAHAVWDNDGGTPVEEDDAPKVRVTIYDNDPAGPWVSIGPGNSATEGDNVLFALTRGNDDMTQPRTVTVNLSETGSMISGTRSRSVEFDANSATATLTVDLDDDNVVEDASVITATIRAPSGYTISGRPWATVEARDNDTAVLGVSANPESIEEGQRSTVTVSITNGVTFAANQVIDLDFTGSTAADTDYTVSPTTLTLRRGQSQTTATITAVNDPDYEGNVEQIRVAPRYGGRTFASTTITIEASDLDASPSAVNYGSATYRVNEGDTVTVTVAVASAQTQDVTVEITMSGTATLTDDYTFTGLTGTNNDVLTITQAGTSASFTIAAVDDADTEGNETIELGFGTITNGTEGARKMATVTINANDGGSPPRPRPPPPRPPPPPQDQPGEVTLSSDQPQVGTELVATLTDADEGIADVTWLWERSTDQDTWSVISDAESASYTPVEADVDQYLRATASYTDGHGPGKTADPAATAAAVIAGDSLLARYDANGNGTIERSEVIAAIRDYLLGEEGVITRSEVIRLINLYLLG